MSSVYPTSASRLFLERRLSAGQSPVTPQQQAILSSGSKSAEGSVIEEIAIIIAKPCDGCLTQIG